MFNPIDDQQYDDEPEDFGGEPLFRPNTFPLKLNNLPTSFLGHETDQNSFLEVAGPQPTGEHFVYGGLQVAQRFE